MVILSWEFIYSRQLQPYVVKCYELAPDGLVAVFEYLEIFTVDDLYKNQSTMREMLTDIAAEFLIGDVGISSVNYQDFISCTRGIFIIKRYLLFLRRYYITFLHNIAYFTFLFFPTDSLLMRGLGTALAGAGDGKSTQPRNVSMPDSIFPKLSRIAIVLPYAVSITEKRNTP